MIKNRRGLCGRIVAALCALAVVACAGPEPKKEAHVAPYPPIIFVHGNGDNSGVWTVLAWRFESNGWPASHLFAVDLPWPLARNDDAIPMPTRSSTTDFTSYLSATVDQVVQQTHSDKIVLVGNSRAGNPIRAYVEQTQGAHVLAVVLGGATNHGVYASTTFNPGSEFNGLGPFLTALNAPRDAQGDEVTAGVPFMTLRSDSNDKYAQPLGGAYGQPNEPTHVGYDGPALKGAQNVVLPGVDHREAAMGPAAFEAMYPFIAKRPLTINAVTLEESPSISGHVFATEGATITNIGLSHAHLTVYEVSSQTGVREGAPVYQGVTGEDGAWGPLVVLPKLEYEFVIEAPGYATTHVYRDEFYRSSPWINLRPVRMSETDRAAGSVVTMQRPRGYFNTARDTILLDGVVPPDIPAGVPTASSARLIIPRSSPFLTRTVIAQFNGERIAVRSWPAADNDLVFAEFTD